MSNHPQIRLHQDWRDNGRRLLVSLYDKMLKLEQQVVGHPEKLRELHRMRLAGKPLRYTGEIFEPVFEKAFHSCFEEIRNFVELIGLIHDRDVQIPLLEDHLQNIQYFNRSVPASKQISLMSLQRCLQQRRRERKAFFMKMCTILMKWKKIGFRQKLIRSMEGKK